MCVFLAFKISLMLQCNNRVNCIVISWVRTMVMSSAKTSVWIPTYTPPPSPPDYQNIDMFMGCTDPVVVRCKSLDLPKILIVGPGGPVSISLRLVQVPHQPLGDEWLLKNNNYSCHPLHPQWTHSTIFPCESSGSD